VLYKHPKGIRIVKQTEWTYWDGGNCPVPKGLLSDVVLRNGSKYCGDIQKKNWSHICGQNDIIAYRITGVAEGYTDEESLV
jgi:hypothetical protein